MSQFGDAVIADGAFNLYLGYYGFCNATAVYRFDGDGDGKCSESDQVFRVTGGFQASPDNPGSVASCADFPNGQDLSFTGFVPAYSVLRVGLFAGDLTVGEPASSDQQVGDAFYLPRSPDSPTFESKGVAGRLQPDQPYTLRFFDPHECTCSHLAPTRQLTFVATPGRNVVTLEATTATAPGPCF